MNTKSAATAKGAWADLYDFTNEDLVTLRTRAAGHLSWSTFFGAAAGLAMITVGLLIDGLPYDGMPLIVLGILALCEPQRTKTPRSAATMERSNRLERRIAKLETGIPSD